MATTAPQGPRTTTTREALGDASTIALVVHGVGDHTSVDILREAAQGPVSLWGDKAGTTTIQIKDLPVPEDINTFAFLRREIPAALQVSVDSRKHIVLPIIWSGVHRRAERSARGDGPITLSTALPTLFNICLDLFRCVPRARGSWMIAVLFLASFFSLLLGSFAVFIMYLVFHLPWWIGAPFYLHWYQPLLGMAAFVLIGSIVRRFSTVFDLLGDVAYYVAQKDLRSKNIEKMTALINVIAESAPNASVLVIGHSLGSVLVSQALARLSPIYAGKGRTVLLTMGSPLGLMSLAFPDHIPSPDSLLDSYRSSGLLLKWINLWRTKDVIGRALKPVREESFTEASLGIGGHANYWNDERVWAVIAKIMRDLPSGNLSGLDQAWQTLPLSSNELEQLEQIWKRLRIARNISSYLIFISLIVYIKGLIPWARQLTPALHVLISLVWGLGFLCLGLSVYIASEVPSSNSPRDVFHNLIFNLTLVRPIMIFGCIDLTIISSACAWQR